MGPFSQTSFTKKICNVRPILLNFFGWCPFGERAPLVKFFRQKSHNYIYICIYIEKTLLFPSLELTPLESNFLELNESGPSEEFFNLVRTVSAFPFSVFLLTIYSHYGEGEVWNGKSVATCRPLLQELLAACYNRFLERSLPVFEFLFYFSGSQMVFPSF